MTRPPNLNQKIAVNAPSEAEAQGQASVDPRLPQAIVHWQFNAQEWQRFLEFDKKKRQRQDTKEATVILVIITLVMGVFLFLGLSGGIEKALPAIGAAAILAGIIALAVVIHFLTDVTQ